MHMYVVLCILYTLTEIKKVSLMQMKLKLADTIDLLFQIGKPTINTSV